MVLNKLTDASNQSLNLLRTFQVHALACPLEASFLDAVLRLRVLGASATQQFAKQTAKSFARKRGMKANNRFSRQFVKQTAKSFARGREDQFA